jgi:hypothetical protein
MEGFNVFTTDEEKVGHVVERREGFLIIECGHLPKHEHAVPERCAHESDGVVRLSVSKGLVHDSPKVDHGLDVLAVSRYYGLVDDPAAGDRGDGAFEPPIHLTFGPGGGGIGP